MMKQFFKYLFAGLLVSVYGTSIIGVGRHYCQCEEAVQVVLPAVGHHACKHHHSRQEEESHCCHAAQEAVADSCAGASETEEGTGEGACCMVQVELLQIDQNRPSLSKIAPDFYSLFFFCPAAALFAGNMPAVAAIAPAHPPPLLDTKHPSFLRVQQWRL